MSCQPFSELSDTQKYQLATNLAALILHDADQDVNSENIDKVLKNSGLKVPDYWSGLMSKALEGKSVGDFLQVSGGSGGNAAVAGQGQAQQQEQKEEEKPETEEEEEDLDMGGFFD